MSVQSWHCRSCRTMSAAGARKRTSSSGWEGLHEGLAHSLRLFSAVFCAVTFGRPLFFLAFFGRPPTDCAQNITQVVQVAMCGAPTCRQLMCTFFDRCIFEFLCNSCYKGRVDEHLQILEQYECRPLPKTARFVLRSTGICRSFPWCEGCICGSAVVVAGDDIQGPHPFAVIPPYRVTNELTAI